MKDEGKADGRAAFPLILHPSSFIFAFSVRLPRAGGEFRARVRLETKRGGAGGLWKCGLYPSLCKWNATCPNLC
jgi:hypothetical protein